MSANNDPSVGTAQPRAGALQHHGNASTPLEGSGYVQELDRRLGIGHLVVYGMVFMVPTAPFAVYGYVAHAGYGMVPLVYLVGIVAMFFTALSYKQLSGVFPFAGSVYSYVQRGLHPYAGFIAGWMILADYLLLPGLLYAFSASWLQGLVPSVPGYVWIIAFVAFNTLINIIGVKLQARTSFLLLSIELVALAIFIVIALKFVLIDGHGAGGWSIKPFYQPEHLNWSFIATATSIAALSFLGFDAISTLAEEVRNPEKTVGTATVVTLLLLGSIFILQTYVAALAYPDYQSLDQQLGFFDIARHVGGPWLSALLIVVSVIATGIANALAAQSAIGRVLYAMGRDGTLPFAGFLAQVHPRFKTPVNSMLLVGVISALVGICIPEEMIIKLVNFGALTAFMLLNVTVVVLFYFRKKMYRNFFKYLLFPLLGLAVVAFVWSGYDKVTFIFGGVWLIVGLAINYFVHPKSGLLAPI